jgi:FAD/FMN-containing dehydrogenase
MRMRSAGASPGLQPEPAAVVRNFGGNVAFTPGRRYTPRTEEEVLELLDRHRDGQVRAAGSLHSWSDAAVSRDALLDLSCLDRVEIHRDSQGQVAVTVGGGCTIQQLLNVLHRQTNATLPTLGVIKKQTVAGAVSTGTHGSGQPSLSHYLDEVRVAAYDPDSGRPRIYHWTGGPELQAARCALGCLGIILSVKLQCVPQYYVEEAIVGRNALPEVLADGQEYPLQHFVLVPYCWKYFVFQRRITPARSGAGQAILARWTKINNLLAVDFALHLLLKLMLLVSSSKQGRSRFIGWFYRAVLPGLMQRKRRVVNLSEAALTMRHDLFRHLEMEVFVPGDNLPRAVDLIQQITQVFAGFSSDVSEDAARQLGEIGMLEELKGYRGRYTHHYPIFFRRVLRDDTLISMSSPLSSGAPESYYSISFFTYLAPDSRDNFYDFARFTSRCLSRLVRARLHWGKYNPLELSDVAPQYPQLEKFRRLCRQVDPRGVFQNDYTARVLGFRGPTPGVSRAELAASRPPAADPGEP